jgi:hypothetical protein
MKESTVADQRARQVPMASVDGVTDVLIRLFEQAWREEVADRSSRVQKPAIELFAEVATAYVQEVV